MPAPNSLPLLRILVARRLGLAFSAEGQAPDISNKDVVNLHALLEAKARSYESNPRPPDKQIMFEGEQWQPKKPTLETVTNWLLGRRGSGSEKPVRRDLRPLLIETLKDARSPLPNHQKFLDQLVQAWERDTRRTPDTQTATETQDTPLPPGSSPTWLVSRTLFEPKLMDFAIEPPSQGASPEAGFELLVWIDGGSCPAPDPAGCFDIALRRFRLSYDAEGCQPSSKSEYPPTCGIDGAGWLFEAGPDQVLRGRLLASTDELMRLRRSGNAALRLRLKVGCADEYDLDVRPRDGMERTSEELLKVAKRYLQKCAGDPDAGASFGEAELRWGMPET